MVHYMVYFYKYTCKFAKNSTFCSCWVYYSFMSVCLFVHLVFKIYILPDFYQYILSSAVEIFIICGYLLFFYFSFVWHILDHIINAHKFKMNEPFYYYESKLFIIIKWLSSSLEIIFAWNSIMFVISIAIPSFSLLVFSS